MFNRLQYYPRSESLASGLPLRTPMYRVAILMLAVLYAAVFHFSAATICNQFGGQPGYRMCVPPNFVPLSFYTGLAVLPALFLPATRKVSSLIIFLVYVMHVFPFIAMYPYIVANQNLGGMLPVIASVTFSVVAMAMATKTISLPRLNVTRVQVIIASLFVYVAAMGTLYTSFDISLRFVSIFDVYDVRSEFKNQLLDTANPIAAYVVTASAYALAPAMVVLSKAFIGKAKIISYIYLGLGIFLSLSVYALAAFKSGVFIMFFTVVICYCTPIFERRYLFYFIVGFGVFAALIFVIGVVHETNPVFAHWYRRAFVLPGINTNLFYNYLGNSLFVGEPGMPGLVSRLYYGTSGSANSGIYGDGMAKAGFIGVMFTVTAFGFMLKAMDAVTTNLPPSLSAAFFLPMAYALSNSSTTAVMLTYGGVASLLFAYMLNEYVKQPWSVNLSARRGSVL